MRKIRLLLWFAAATATAVFAALYVADRMAPPPPGTQERLQTAEQVARDVVTGEFTLMGGDGEPVSDTDFRGRWLLIFFGYTHCPDVCPTSLGTMALIVDELGDHADALQPLFISVDPARDTREIIAEYVAVFHPRIIGLTGSEEQVAAAARSHRAYYAKVPLSDGEGTGDDYAVDHSAHLYLMDPDGVYATVFSPTDTVEAVVGAIRARMATKSDN
jgi:protein SCO1/2